MLDGWATNVEVVRETARKGTVNASMEKEDKRLYSIMRRYRKVNRKRWAEERKDGQRHEESKWEKEIRCKVKVNGKGK